jgi:hypothetical protein
VDVGPLECSDEEIKIQKLRRVHNGVVEGALPVVATHWAETRCYENCTLGFQKTVGLSLARSIEYNLFNVDDVQGWGVHC